MEVVEAQLPAGSSESEIGGSAMAAAAEIPIYETMKLVIGLVPEFSGDREELIFFLNACDLIDDVTPEANKSVMLRTIVTKLRGQAYHEATRFETVDSWGVLKKLLIDEYDNKDINPDFYEIFVARQKPNETIEVYGSRVRKLLWKLCKWNTRDWLEGQLVVKRSFNEQIKNAFTLGLINDDLKFRMRIYKERAKTLEHAIQMAIIEEKNLEGTRSDDGNTRFEQKKFNKVCSNCQRIGHFAKQCRQYNINNNN